MLEAHKQQKKSILSIFIGLLKSYYTTKQPNTISKSVKTLDFNSSHF